MNVNELIELYEKVISNLDNYISGKWACKQSDIQRLKMEREVYENFIRHLRNLTNLEYNRKVKVPAMIDSLIGDYWADNMTGSTSKDKLLSIIIEDWRTGFNGEYWHEGIWIEKNFCEFVDAVRHDYEVEEEPKYYWRKKDKHTSHLDTRVYLVTGVDLQGSLGKGTKERFTESEAKRLLEEDFDMFDKLESY